MPDASQDADAAGTAFARSLAEAVSAANVPTLIAVLVQLTGELSWLEPPYAPTRNRGVSDNDTGGLDHEQQEAIREAARVAITAWKEGRPPAIAKPTPDQLIRILSVAMGELIPAEYGPMIDSEMRGLLGHAPDEAPVRYVAPPADVPRSVLIVGAGASGLCAAQRLGEAGIPYTILEKSQAVGGNWLDNGYPGAGVDTPCHLYSFSFAPYDFSRYFAGRDELLGYFNHIADSFGIREHIRFGTEVLRATWDAEAQEWEVETVDAHGRASRLRSTFLVSAVGIYNPIKTPDIPGLDDFAGEVCHTAAWPEGLELAGKRVALVGNGASAMQTGPAIAGDVQQLTIFQRSPQWVSPFEQFHKQIPDSVRWLFREVPLYRAWYRLRLGWTFNDKLYPSLQKDPQWGHPERSLNAVNDGHREWFTRYLTSELDGRPDLVAASLPDYPPYGKRMLLDNGWFKMLKRPNVQLVTSRIARVDHDAVVTSSGDRVPADVIVLATGFDVVRFLSTFELRGRSGRPLRETWGPDDARAYLGLVVPDFPNFFSLYGPNTQPGHGGSILFVIECQANYMVSAITQLAQRGQKTMECKPDVHRAYNEDVDAAHARMVWTHPGMETFYRNSRGRVVVNLPYRYVDLWRMLSRVDWDDYLVEEPAAGSRAQLVYER